MLVKYRRSALQLVGLALSVITHVATAAAAEEPERTQARALGYAGVQAYAVNDFVTASVRLEEAYRLVAVPSLGLWSARALVKLGRWVEAEERYRSVGELVVSASDSDVQRTAQEDAAREREALLSEMPSVQIDLSHASPAEVTASIDGVPVDAAQLGRERWVNPGRHVVIGVRGAEKSELVFEARAKERKQLQLRFAAALRNPNVTAGSSVVARRDAGPDAALYGTLRGAGWIALAAGGAGLVTGSFAYWMGRRHYTTLESQNWCANGACDPSDVDAYNTWRAVHLAGLIGGGVLGAAGLGLLIATPTAADGASPRTTVSVRFDSPTLILDGSF